PPARGKPGRRKPVTGHEPRSAKAGIAEPLGKSCQGGSMNRLPATARDTPARHVDPFEVSTAPPPHAQVIREIRREAHGCVMLRDRAQPGSRPLDETVR